MHMCPSRDNENAWSTCYPAGEDHPFEEGWVNERIDANEKWSPGQPLTAVLFDLDGTMIDTIDLIRDSFVYAARTVLGEVPPDDVLLANVGTPLDNQMEALSSVDAPALLEAYRRYNHAHHDERVKEYPNMRIVLEALRDRDVRIGVVTSKSRALAERGLAIVGYRGFVDHMVAVDDGYGRKPAPQPVLACADALDSSTRDAVFVGDSPYDIIAGNNANIYTIAVVSGPFSKAVLETEKPDAILDEIGQLTQLLVDGGPRRD